MSAICGIVYFNGKKVEANKFEKIMSSLSHRGIDGSGTWCEGAVAFGHQMLAITPESLEEKLPYCHRNSSCTITSDARIDNREELFQKLDIPYYDQKDIPDSILILKAYEKWEKECVKHLLGDFIFVIWDAKKKQILCATDPMGMRTIFYYQDVEKFIFSSEIKGIHALGIERKPNLRKIAMISTLGTLSNDFENTFFENIFVIPAAEIITINPNGLEKHHYWVPDTFSKIKLKNEEEYIEAFQDVFFKAVKARTRSAFKVASLYSGGLDSSAITVAAGHLLNKEGKIVNALSAVLPDDYKGKLVDEREYIDMLKGAEGINIQYITDPWRGPFDNLEKLIFHGEKPVYTSRHYLYTAFAEAADKIGARVMLDGCFGEMGPSFHGDGYYAELFLKGKWIKLAKELSLKGNIENLGVLRLLKGEVIKPIIPNYLQDRLHPRFDVDQNEKLSVIKGDFIKRQLGEEVEVSKNKSEKFFTTYPNHLKNQLIACSARQSKAGNGFVGYEKVESAYPFTDKRIIEFCLGIPGDMKVHNGYKRYTIRSGMKGLLPDKMRFRTTKEPFSPDFNIRYNNQKEKIREMLLSVKRNDLIKEIVDIEKLQKLLEYTMVTNRCNTPEDFAAMHMVPRGIYLLYFLSTFD